MANEFAINYESGNTLYSVLRNAAGKVLDGTVDPYHSTNSWVDWNIANVDNYDLAMVDKNGDLYVGSMPSGTLIITDVNVYKVQTFLRLGANPADGDTLVGVGEIVWNGSSEGFVQVNVKEVNGTTQTAGDIIDELNGIYGQVADNYDELGDLKAQHESAEFGFIPIKIAIDAINAYLTDGGSIDVSLDTLLSRLTAARAVLLDNLDRKISTAESNIRGADSDTLKTLSGQIDKIPIIPDAPSIGD